MVESTLNEGGKAAQDGWGGHWDGATPAQRQATAIHQPKAAEATDEAAIPSAASSQPIGAPAPAPAIRFADLLPQHGFSVGRAAAAVLKATPAERFATTLEQVIAGLDELGCRGEAISRVLDPVAERLWPAQAKALAAIIRKSTERRMAQTPTPKPTRPERAAMPRVVGGFTGTAP